MKLKKLTQLFLTIFALAGTCFFTTGCEDNNLEDAADEVGDAAEEGADNVEDAVN